jgi:D-alanyl-D-alanine carboxypeptidase
MLALLLAASLNAGAIDATVRTVMRAEQIAGISVGIARDGAVQFEGGYGFSDLGRRSPAQPETVYRIGSLTKSFTAACVLSLQQQHALGLDDPIGQYLTVPWPQVSIRELLEQRSGIPSYSDDPALDRYASYTPEQLVRAVAHPLNFPGDSEFQYSNTNYVLLGMIASKAARTPYDRYLQTAILAPLHLTHTRYGDQPGEAHGYARDTLRMPVQPSSVSYAYAAAGMTSNVPDLLRWLSALRPPYYGLLRAQMYGYEVYYATGHVDGFSAFELLVPRTHDEIAVLTNANVLDLTPLVKSLFALIEPPVAQTYAAAFTAPQNEDLALTGRVRKLLGDLRRGTVDRWMLSAKYQSSLSADQLANWQDLLAPRGDLTLLEFTGREQNADCSEEHYRATFAGGSKLLVTVCVAAASIDDIRIERP